MHVCVGAKRKREDKNVHIYLSNLIIKCNQLQTNAHRSPGPYIISGHAWLYDRTGQKGLCFLWSNCSKWIVEVTPLHDTPFLILTTNLVATTKILQFCWAPRTTNSFVQRVDQFELLITGYLLKHSFNIDELYLLRAIAFKRIRVGGRLF